MYQYGTYGGGYQAPYGGGYYPNNNYNPYNSNGGAVAQQPSYVQQPAQTQQPSQYTFLPLTFVNGIEGVNKFVVPLNQSVYLRDSNSDTLYIKSTNTQGQTNIEQFKLVKSDGQTNNSPSVQYVTKEDFNALTMALSEFRSILLGEIKTLLNEPKKEVIGDVK